MAATRAVLNQEPAKLDFKWRKGNAFKHYLRLLLADGTYDTFTGKTITAPVYKQSDLTTVITDLIGVTPTISVINGIEHILLYAPESVADTLDKCFWELVFTDGDGDDLTRVEGQIFVREPWL